jgi:hypothetical protein
MRKGRPEPDGGTRILPGGRSEPLVGDSQPHVGEQGVPLDQALTRQFGNTLSDLGGIQTYPALNLDPGDLRLGVGVVGMR